MGFISDYRIKEKYNCPVIGYFSIENDDLIPENVEYMIGCTYDPVGHEREDCTEIYVVIKADKYYLYECRYRFMITDEIYEISRDKALNLPIETKWSNFIATQLVDLENKLYS